MLAQASSAYKHSLQEVLASPATAGQIKVRRRPQRARHCTRRLCVPFMAAPYVLNEPKIKLDTAINATLIYSDTVKVNIDRIL